MLQQHQRPKPGRVGQLFDHMTTSLRRQKKDDEMVRLHHKVVGTSKTHDARQCVRMEGG